MMRNGRVLLIEIDFREFIVLFALEVLVPAEVLVRDLQFVRLFMIKYEFNFSKFDWRRSSSVASAKSSEPLLAGTKYLVDSSGP